jgi:hypothetical protein
MEERPNGDAGPIAAFGQPQGRRKLLKTGLIGGPVTLLVAGTPIKSFASKKKVFCKFSGWNSVKVVTKKKSKGKGKGVTASNAPATCSDPGYLPSHYVSNGNAANWPSSFNGVTLHANGGGATVFSNIFGADPVGGLANTSLLNILKNYSSSVEAYIIAAAFSSVQTAGYPYTQAGVVGLWQKYGNNSIDTGTLTNAQALLSFLTQLV